MTRTDTHETWMKQEDGSMILVNSHQSECEVQSPQELIVEKEQELLKMYADLQALKAQQNNG